MSKPAIEINNLSKAYMIGHERAVMTGTMTFRDSLVSVVRKPIELITGHQLKKEKFWALKNLSLEIDRGDVVGIIGRNGSGKSTLLKILSRIVEPTHGEAVLRGRVASLLEVGTGFHPELTGRENVFFNGAILGMSRKEINAKFDEIVAFSEVEKFLDTPVKFYSSGMYVRLAFAVAAHLDPDILIVDEVLAVGDAAFQEKCLGKMKDVAGQGRTVIFVSHNMASVRALCKKGILMQAGRAVLSGGIDECIRQYASSSRIKASSLEGMRDKDARIKIEGFKVESSEDKLSVILRLKSQDIIKGARIGYGIDDKNANRICTLFNVLSGDVLSLKKGQNTITCTARKVHLKPGEYSLDVFIGTDLGSILHIQDPIPFEITTNKLSEKYSRVPDDSQGSVLVEQSWQIR